jgi:radical SAM superfamily enzyme YgiQ (UPF0313 family)
MVNTKYCSAMRPSPAASIPQPAAAATPFFSEQGHRLQDSGLRRPHPNPTLANPPWNSSPLRVLILRLSPFRDVDRSSPHLFLAQAAREAEPQAYLDFCFFPTAADRRLLEASGIPLITGLESYRPLSDFDLVLASCSYHLELLNLPRLLLGSGVPLRAGERGQAFPPLILGGSSVPAAQALIAESGDCLADGLFFGEGEVQAATLIRRLAGPRGQGKPARLEAAAEVEGFWPAGDLSRPVRQAVCRDPRARQTALRYPLLSGPEAGNARLQLTFGCPFRCSFCFEGHQRRPFRLLPAAELLEAARELKRASGARTLELDSFNVNAHPELPGLLLELNRLFPQVNFMSQRADILERSPDLLEAELAAGKRSFTLGIEGVSERQRHFLQKRLGEAVIRRLLARLLEARVREVKLFFLMSGYESDEDFGEFRRLLAWIAAERRRSGAGARLIFSFNRLMRMPFTPLRYDRLFLEQGHWRPLLDRARQAVEAEGFEFRLASSWEEYAAGQVLALGGYWLHEPLRLLAEKGCCYEGGLQPEAWRLLSGWLAGRPELRAALLAEKPEDYPFAFGFVRPPIPSQALYRAYRLAREALEQASSASKPPSTPARLILKVPPGTAGRLAELASARRRLQPLHFTARLPRLVAGASPEWLNAWLLRELLGLRPRLTANLLEAREELLITEDPRRQWPPWYGRTRLALLAWDPEELRLELGSLSAFGPASPGPASTSPVPAPPASELVLEPEPTAPAMGGYRRLELRLHLPERFFPDPGPRLQEYLANRHAPATARREGAGYRLEPAEKARRKGMLLAGRFEPVQGGTRLELSVGPRFEPRAYLALFRDPDAWREALIEVLGFRLD